MPGPTLNFNSLMDSASTTAEGMMDSAVQIQNEVQAGNQILQQREESARQTAEAAATVKTIQLQDQARIEAQRRASALRLGMDPAQSGYLLSQQQDKVIEADKKMSAARQSIEQIDSVSFLDNPLGFLVGQLSVNSYIKAYNSAESEREQAASTAKALQQNMDDTMKNVNALTSTVSDAYIQASRVVAGHEALMQASDAALQARRLNIDGITHAASLSKDALNIRFSAQGAIMAKKQYENAQAHLALSVKEFNLREKQFKDKQEADDYLANTIKTGFQNLNGGKMLPDATARQYAEAYRLNKNNPLVAAMFDSGLASQMAGGKSIIAASPFDASSYISNRQVTNLPPAQQQAAEQLVTWRRNWEQSRAGQEALASKDKNLAERSFNEWIKTQGTTGNPVYAPTGAAQTVANNKNLATLPVWSQVLEPAAKTGIYVDDPDTAFGLILNAVKEKKISYVDAVDYSKIVAGGLAITNQARNFASFGMPQAHGNPVQIQIPGQLGKTTINTADQNEIARAINKAWAFYASGADNKLIGYGAVGRAIVGFGSLGIPLQPINSDPATQKFHEEQMLNPQYGIGSTTRPPINRDTKIIGQEPQ